MLKTALAENRLVFACGPAGTGKTRACVDRAVDLLLSEQVEKLVFCRPAVPADEDIGALPGDVREKLAGYLQPLLDELSEKLGGGAAANHMIEKWFRDGTLQIVPVGMMRGRTFKNTAIVADEMQNATLNQIKMVVTRLGQGSTMAITGDTEQSDLGARSGLSEALKRFEDNGYPVIRLDRGDVQRDPIVADILRFL